MGKTKLTLVGWEKTQNDFIKWSESPKRSLPTFLDTIQNTTLSLLRQNTPIDTGELVSSWRVLERTPTSIEIGVTDDQEAKLQFVVYGTQYQRPNNFMQLVDSSINNLINVMFGRTLVQQHRFWKPIIGKTNITATVGLTGTSYNKRRSRGRASVYRPKTGRLGTRVRIGRRRTTAGLGNSFFKDIKIG